MRVLVVLGTRPEAIKLAPVISALGRDPGAFTVRTCLTAQHRELVEPILRGFRITPDHWLDAMRPGQSLAALAGRVFAGLDRVIALERPDWVIVQGDTTTAMAGAVVGHYLRCKIAHVEAGLRSFDKDNPFPEEVNRRIATAAADLHFAPSEPARENLVREGVPSADVFVTGNTVIDALRSVVEATTHQPDLATLLPTMRPGARLILATTHRRENVGEPLRQICAALRDIATRYDGSVHVALPVHLNPAVQSIVAAELHAAPHVTLLPPQGYFEFVRLLSHCHCVLTDSGGVQEEAPYLRKPVLVLRETTERPEGVDAGCSKVVGTDRDRIVGETVRLLDDPIAWRRMATAKNPYGDGHAADRIAAALAGRAQLAGTTS
jgi:UDP-N-acetylglucosamine 2-epimerase (non-hydrolysing)